MSGDKTGSVTIPSAAAELIERPAGQSPITSLEYLTHIANAFDPVEGPVEFDPNTWTRIRNAIYDLSSAPSESVTNLDSKRLIKWWGSRNCLRENNIFIDEVYSLEEWRAALDRLPNVPEDIL